MISYNDAKELIAIEFYKLKLKTELIRLEDASLRTLADDVYADINLPPFDNAAVDGIAIKYNDGNRGWKLIGEISAGNYKELKIDANSAVAIMTGAKIPDGCDTVIPMEDILIEDNLVSLKNDVKSKRGMNIRRTASDIAIDELAIAKGTLLKSRHLASLASCGKDKVLVYKKMTVGVLVTGDELIPVALKPESDKLRVSNNYSLCGIIRELNQYAVNLGFAGDNRDRLKVTLANTLSSELDILITTGGVSMGKHDYIRDLFHELGVKEIFRKTGIRPGKPAFFGKWRDKLIFALPGNPVSCLVNFEIYIKPFIMNLYGMGEVETVNARLQNDLQKRDSKRHFFNAFLSEAKDGRHKVTSQLSQSSGNVIGLSKANCLIEISEEKLNPRKGEIVKCIKI
ncbi:MAG: molybdopterin molybdotransferase MoeA [Melioribacteraceae bacterium]|nr:molybdopterin molybdotransferase MoeA [Melioribacteraceae bacterium]